MRNINSLNHSKWECMFHVTWISKYRKKKIYGNLRQYLGEIFRELAIQKKCRILEGHLMHDHVHMLISVPPKFAVAQVIGYIKGKSAIAIARKFGGRIKNFTCQHFWARGYHVSTVGRDEEAIRKYIRKHEDEDRRLDQQLDLFE